MRLDARTEALAKDGYQRWFARCSEKNPSDINSKEKYDFAAEIGWEQLQAMQRARKQNTAANGYPYSWTQREFWGEPTSTGR